MKYWYLLIAAFLLSSCDIITLDDVYEESVLVVNDTSEIIDGLPSSAPRKAFLEYYTGHLCGNCPESGGKTVNSLKDLYDTNLVVMSIHAGFFARNNASGASFFTNFRTTSGNDLDSEYGVTVSGTPKGIVNRSSFQNSTIQTPSNWGSSISQTILTSTENVLVANKSFSNDTTLSFSVKYRKPSAATLEFYIVEDSIIDWQRDYSADPEDSDDYPHRFVLRDKINAVSTDETTGQLSFEYTFPSTWSKQHLHIISLIRDDEVLQADYR